MDMKGNLNSFCFYFTRYFEEQLLYWRHVLEESPDLKAKSTSKPVSILSSLTSAIPTVGKAVGSGITEGEKYINQRIDKNKAFDIASIVYSSSEDKDSLRNNLIDGAYMVFSCYEYQFSKITCEHGGTTRAMQKIAQDASNRLFTYLLKDDTIKVITWEIVAKGILYGESKRHTKKLLKFGRTLSIIEDGSTITTSDFFINCGIRIKNDDILTYYIKENHVPLLGHRLLFDFEDRILKSFIIDSPTYSYKYYFINCDKQQEIKDIYQYITTKDPMENLREFAKFTFEEQLKLFEEATEQRQDIVSKLLEESAANQKETKETIEASQNVIMNHLEIILTENTNLLMSRTDEILQKHEELSKDIAVLKENDEKRSGEAESTIIVVNMDKVKSEGQRLGENVKSEAKKVENEVRRFHKRIKNIKL